MRVSQKGIPAEFAYGSGVPRRRFLKGAAVTTVGVGASVLFGCGDSDDENDDGSPTQGAGDVSPTAKPAEQIKRGGTLKVGFRSQPQYLDPHAPGGGFDHRVFWTIHEGLVNFDEQGLSTADASLSRNWEQPDLATYVFNLREGVTFHDGTPFNGDAVKSNFERVLAKETNSPGASDLAIIDKLEVISANQVKVTTKQPWAPFLASLSDRGGMMVSPTAALKLGEGLRTAPVGTGPYQFQDWTQESRIRLTKNAAYWDKAPDGQPLPYLDGIEWLVIPDDTVRNASLDTGDLDMALDVPEKDVEALSKKHDVVSTPGAFVGIHLHNLAQSPISDPRVRQAMSLAIDREAFLKAVYFNVGRPCNGAVYPIYSSVFEDSRPFPAQDLAKAKSLLAEAGFADGLTVSSVAIPNQVQRVEVVQAMWAQVGIKVDNTHGELPAYRQKFFFDKSIPLAFATFTPRADVDGVVRNLWHSKGFWNPGKNTSVDSLVDKGAATLDTAERKAVYADLSTAVIDDALHVMEAFGAYITAVSKRAAGFTPGFGGKGRWRLAWRNV